MWVLGYSALKFCGEHSNSLVTNFIPISPQKLTIFPAISLISLTFQILSNR